MAKITAHVFDAPAQAARFETTVAGLPPQAHTESTVTFEDVPVGVYTVETVAFDAAGNRLDAESHDGITIDAADADTAVVDVLQSFLRTTVTEAG